MFPQPHSGIMHEENSTVPNQVYTGNETDESPNGSPNSTMKKALKTK
jgi:hypothetical protein